MVTNHGMEGLLRMHMDVLNSMVSTMIEKSLPEGLTRVTYVPPPASCDMEGGWDRKKERDR